MKIKDLSLTELHQLSFLITSNFFIYTNNPPVNSLNLKSTCSASYSFLILNGEGKKNFISFILTIKKKKSKLKL